ncbi:jumonji domain-containing protein 6 [Phlyctochytrium bullatum]|nr:jumonji domain-containing protein 6 [Phlyctochytrium bullatum]
MMMRKRRRSSAEPEASVDDKLEGSDGAGTTKASSNKRNAVASALTQLDSLRKLQFEELDVNYGWSRMGYANFNFWIDPSRDKVPRCDYHTCSHEEFIEKYEAPAVPVVITGATDDWPAQSNWLPEVKNRPAITNHEQNMAEKYHGEKFKIGEDDDGDSVYMQFSHFVQYSLTSGDAAKDDSPLYIFDSVYGDRTRNYSAKRIPKKKNKKEADREKTDENGERDADRACLEQEANNNDNVGSDEEGDIEEVADEAPKPKRMRWDVKPDDSGKDIDVGSQSPTNMNTTQPDSQDLNKSEEKITITIPVVPKVERTSRKPESQATRELLKDYEIPKYFRDDLFQFTGSKRPPYRWMVIGAARSGTGIHVVSFS